PLPIFSPIFSVSAAEADMASEAPTTADINREKTLEPFMETPYLMHGSKQGSAAPNQRVKLHRFKCTHVIFFTKDGTHRELPFVRVSFHYTATQSNPNNHVKKKKKYLFLCLTGLFKAIAAKCIFPMYAS